MSDGNEKRVRDKLDEDFSQDEDCLPAAHDREEFSGCVCVCEADCFSQSWTHIHFSFSSVSNGLYRQRRTVCCQDSRFGKFIRVRDSAAGANEERDPGLEFRGRRRRRRRRNYVQLKEEYTSH